MSHTNPLIQLDNISLSYGTVVALEDLSLSVSKGEIHAVVGEHGAGKSSLVAILAGYATPDSGTIAVNGRRHSSLSVGRARSEGISIVKQSVALCDHLSVATNIYMNSDGFFRRHKLSKRRARDSVRSFLEERDVALPLDEQAGNLKLADKVMVEIMRGLYREPQLLILDEALEKLTTEGLERVVGQLRAMRDEGKSVLFVTHRVDDIFQIADRVSIVRKGEVVINESVKEIDKFSLVKMAYTQLPASGAKGYGDTEFYHLLRYNQAILESLPISLLVVDNAIALKLVNTSAARYFGIAEGTNDGMSLREIFAENEALYRRITNSIAEPATTTLFNQQFSVSGDTRILNISIVPIRDESWRIGSILMIEDATEREKLREQVFLSEKLGSIGVLASGIAHEICNPLEIISNDITYLKSLYGSTIDLSILKEIKEEVESINRIVRNLDRLPGSEKRTIEPSAIGSIVRSVVTFVSPVAEQQDVTLEFRDTAGESLSRVGSDDLRQILLNLIKNALEAVHPGGSVLVQVKADDSRTMVVIEDDGPGIPESDRHQVFLPFFSTKATSVANRGLGLYVSYQLVTENGGTIEIDSRRPTGCRFTLAFPKTTISESRRAEISTTMQQ